MATIQRITPCLWFDTEAEEAAKFYAGIFPNSRVGTISRYPKSDFEPHRGREGKALMVEFELDGQRFTALNGGPFFKFTEALSLQIACRDQAEFDYYWEALRVGGPVEAQQCGWLKDRYGVSWQVVPDAIPRLFTTGDAAARERLMKAMIPMKRLDIAALERAHAGS